MHSKNTDRIDQEILREVEAHLNVIEQTHGVRILYACESGSRAWGFESQDSDYDVRFIYVRPQDWYLAINVEVKRDVIELPINDVLDISGWDLRKALQLFHKSNPPLNEWLVSPIVYREFGQCAERLRELAPESYNPIAAHYHYLRMAENNYRAHLRGEQVKRKKYFYVLRPLLAVNWLEQERGVVPTEFEKLVDGVVSDAGLRNEISELLALKRAGKESDEGTRFHGIHAFIDGEMERHGPHPSETPGSRADVETLNGLFRAILQSDASAPT